MTSAVCNKYDITTGSITFALDGKEALSKASSLWPLLSTDPDFDLLSDIRSKLRSLPVQVKWQWIEGHQDKHTPFFLLSDLSKDNCVADSLAKNRLNQCLSERFQPVSQRFGNEGWSISLDGVKLSHLNFSRLYSHFWADTSFTYWSNKHKVDYTDVISIDWDNHGKALDSLSFAKRRRVVKHATGHFGNGIMMKRWGCQSHTECTMCSAPENPTHISRCPDPRSVDVWNKALTKLENSMLRKYTDPVLSSMIIKHLKA